MGGDYIRHLPLYRGAAVGGGGQGQRQFHLGAAAAPFRKAGVGAPLCGGVVVGVAAVHRPRLRRGVGYGVVVGGSPRVGGSIVGAPAVGGVEAQLLHIGRLRAAITDPQRNAPAGDARLRFGQQRDPDAGGGVGALAVRVGGGAVVGVGGGRCYIGNRIPIVGGGG